MTFNFKIENAVSLSDSATLSLNLVGGSIEGTEVDHHAAVWLNGTWIGACEWPGIELFSCELSFPQNLLINGSNTLDVTGILASDVGYSIFYVDSFDVHYNKNYQAVNSSLLFTGDANRVVTIDGFDGDNVFVLDVSDSLAPKLVSIKNKRSKNSNSWISFRPEHADSNYFAISQSAVTSVIEIAPYSFKNLKTRKKRAQYLVITPSDLIGAAQQLAEYRSAQGYMTEVVVLETIIAEFNHGIYSPLAIKNFLSYAYNNWKMPPEYVVLVGDATYDYRDVMGYGGNLMPTVFVSTPNGLFASDNYLADVNDDGIPDMAIGRLPVLTEDELIDILDKIKNYESYTGAQKDKILLLADNPEEGADFTSDSNRISGVIPPDYSQKKIYLSDNSLNVARQKLFDELTDGAAFVNYIGHSGTDRLAQEGLLLSTDVETISTNGISPVITDMTCVVGEFIFPPFDPLAELMLLQPNGGATAVWSPSGLSENAEARILDSLFYSALNHDGEKILGDSILNALNKFSQSGHKSYHILIYNLLGDPALQLH